VREWGKRGVGAQEVENNKQGAEVGVEIEERNGRGHSTLGICIRRI
jgi:hypothetical protein